MSTTYKTSLFVALCLVSACTKGAGGSVSRTARNTLESAGRVAEEGSLEGKDKDKNKEKSKTPAGNANATPGKDGVSKTNGTSEGEVADAPAASADGAPPSGEPTPIETYNQEVETRALGDILCQETPRLADKHQDDFTDILAGICAGNTTNETYTKIMNNAYQGQGAPAIEVLKAKSDERYVTQLTYAYAVKVNIASPDKVADLDMFKALEQGLSRDGSSMTLTVESRQMFPGGGSLEEVKLSYRTLHADGAALFDKRRTYANQYLPSELTRDITVTLESLLDADTNEHYHVSRQLTAGIKNDDNTTTMLYVTEMVVKNRIDPARLQRAALTLAAVTAEKTYEIANSAQPTMP